MNLNDWKLRFGAEIDQAEAAILDELSTHNTNPEDWDKLCEIRGVIGDKWWLYAMLGMCQHRRLGMREELI